MTAATPRSIDEYLQSLKAALAGADPALIQDALYDAEEHLRAELAQNPAEPEEQLLTRIVTTYGAPDEVADAYRANEARVQAALRTPAPTPHRSTLGRFFGVYSDPRAYLSLLYMLLALFTGVVYFTFAVTGLSLSVGLAILIIGVPVFLLFIGVARVLSLAEGRLVESMLGTRMPRRPLYPAKDVPFLQRIWEMLKDRRTWTTLLYQLLMLPLGVGYFCFAVIGLTLSIAFIVMPFVLLGYYLDLIHIDGLIVAGPEHPALLPLVAILGIVLLTVLLHLSRGIGYLHGQLAKSLLVPVARA
jgi:uncharacterized membrane protein